MISVVTMRDSWRAGVSEKEKTKLVTNGIYQISRNHVSPSNRKGRGEIFAWCIRGRIFILSESGMPVHRQKIVRC